MNSTEHKGDPPSVRLVEVDEGSAGQRLDNYLIRELKGVPKSRIYRIIRRGEVRINKARARPETRLVAGDQVRLPPLRTSVPTPGPGSELGEQLEKSIIYEDNVMLIINKPAGLAVHGGSGLSWGIIEALRAARPASSNLELVHRLDRETSGCLMMAKRRSWLRRIQQVMRERAGVRKTYLAIVHGRWPKGLERLNAPVERTVLKGGERLSRVSEAGKRSLTTFRPVFVTARMSVVEAVPVTGRTHQIRVHCRQAGHPIVGDAKYGDRAKDLKLKRRGYSRMMLHATRLEIPALGEYPPLVVSAPLDDSMRALIREIKSNYNK